MARLNPPAPLPEPNKHYSATQAAPYLGISERTLFRKLADKDDDGRFKDQFLNKVNPQLGMGGEWRFVGANILSALGSVTYNAQENTINTPTIGAETQ